MQEFSTLARAASEKLLAESVPRNFSIQAGCEKFINILKESGDDKEKVIRLADEFIKEAGTYRESIAKYGVSLINKDDAKILIHSYSRVVMHLLKHAALQNRRFKVYVTESRPSLLGERAHKELKELGVPSELVPDTAVGFLLDGQVDLVLVGAEGVALNGGLINQVGTYQIAVVAKAAGVPFYAVTESYKFVKEYPLNQMDLQASHGIEKVASINVDYTPPALISSYVTDLRVLTPSAVVNFLLS
ncbi:Translation initiation factor [Irineochytrium annulatum]|nr:Translation initiation factor [Irineochytrium annulatum]